MAAVFPASAWDQILRIILVILGIALTFVVLRFVLKVAAKFIAYGCLAILIIAVLYGLLRYFGVF